MPGSKLGDGHRDSLGVVAGGEDQGEQELIPAGQQAENAGGDHPGQRQWEHDLPNDREAVGPVDQRGFLQRYRNALKIRAKHPDHERQHEGHVNQRQKDLGVGHVQLLHDHIQGQDQGNFRQHAQGDNAEHHGVLPAKLQTGKGIGREDTNQHAQEGGTDRHHDAIAHGGGKGRDFASADGGLLQAQELQIIVEGGFFRNPMGRRCDQLHLWGDGGDEQPDKGDDDIDHQQDRKDVDEDPFAFFFPSHAAFPFPVIRRI